MDIEVGLVTPDGWICKDVETFQNGVGALFEPEQPVHAIVPKRMYAFRGSPYEIGYLMGMMSTPDPSNSGTWEEISEDFNRIFKKFMEKHPEFRKFFHELVMDACEYVWDREQERAHIPSWFDEELNGIVAGSNAAHPSTPVTRRDMIFPNYVAVLLMTWVLDDLNVNDRLIETARSLGHDFGMAKDLLGAITHEDLSRLSSCLVPDCDGYAVKGEALASKKGVLLARNLQAGSRSWAHSASYIARLPSPDQSWSYRGQTTPLLPTLAIGFLGQVGALTCMNAEGVGSGTQTLRSSAVAPDEVGIGGGLLCRYTVEVGRTTREGIEAAKRSVRGAPYIHIMGDRSGNLAALEIVTSKPEVLARNPYDYFQANTKMYHALKEFIPSTTSNSGSKGAAATFLSSSPSPLS
ncbi:MAG: hypothetical protein AAF492_23615 [Verrucomicrobiota bacterium]